MSNKKMIILVVSVTLILAGIAFLFKEQKPIDWSPTFLNVEKKPYDTYISYRLLNDIFPDGSVESTRKYPSNTLEYTDYYIEDYDYEQDEHLTSYIFVNKTFTCSEYDLEYLLDLAYYGGNVFISSESFAQNLLDSVYIGVNKEDIFWGNNKDTIYQLIDYPDRKYNFKSILTKNSFYIKDDSPYTYRILGTQVLKNGIVKGISFIQINYGDGKIYLHANPVAFTNVCMLDSTKYDYAFRCLSYLPKSSEVIWDESQKDYPFDYRETNLFKVIVRYKPLLMALIVTIVAGILFMLFRSKRTQRIIPVIKPPKNTSLEFLDTISNLYYIKADSPSIAEYRYNFFMDIVRKKYYLSTETINDEFVKTLSLKSNVEIDTIERIFELYKYIKNSGGVSNKTFIEFNDALEKFYKESNQKNI